MSELLPINWQNKINSPELLAFLQQYGEENYLSAEEINELRDKINLLIINRPTDVSQKLDRGGYPGTAQDIVDSIHDPVDISGKLDKGDYSGTATTLKDEIELLLKNYTDQVAALKLNQKNSTTSTPQAYIKKADGTQAMFNVESVLNGSVNSLTDSLGVKNYTDAELLLKENNSNKAVNFNTINDVLYPTVKSVKAQLDMKIPDADKGVANGVASLGSDGKIPNSQIPSLAISETFPVSSQAQMLALSTAEQGDVAIRSDISKSFILRISPASVLGNWSELLSPSDAVQSVNGQVGNVNLTTAQVPDTANKRYQTDNQRAFNDATSSIQDQINQRLPIGGNAVSASKWINAIALTIGNTFKAIDGTTNVVFTLAEIGAVKIGDDITAPNFIGRLQGIADYANVLVDYIGGNQIRLGWDGNALNLRVNNVNFGSTLPISISGNATSATNWGSRTYNDLESNVAPAYVMALKTNGVYSPHTSVAIQNFLGLNNGSTLNNSISGNSNSATNWSTAGAYTPTEQSQLITYLMSYNADNGTWKPANADYVKQFLGLNGFNPDNYLPLTGGSLSGRLLITNDSYIMFEKNGSPRVLLAPTGHIQTGGTMEDFNTYLYGNQPYGIWTNGLKRFEVNGLGVSSFNGDLIAKGNIVIPNSTALVLGGDNDGGATLRYNSNGNLDISPRAGYNTVFTNGRVIANDSMRCYGNMAISGYNPYLQFLDDLGTRRGRIQHDGTNLSIITDVGNVSIESNLAVVGTVQANGAVRVRASSPYYEFRNDNNEQIGYIQHNGSYMLLSAGNGYFQFGNSVIVTGSITASAGFFNSDERLKDIVKRDGDVVHFTWKDKRDEKTHIGYIAQEVQKTNPDQVQEDEKGFLSVNYVEILVRKMSEMEKEMSVMRKEIQQMKGGKNGVQ